MSLMFGMRHSNQAAGASAVSVDFRPRNYREMAFKLFPGSPAPLTYLMSKLPSRTTNDPEYKIFEYRLPQMVWTTASHSAGTVTFVTGEAYGLKNGDILEMEGTGYQWIVTTETTDGDTAVLTAHASTGGTLTNGGADVLRWVGSIYAEGSQAPSSIMREASVVYNYTQIFKDTVKITGTAAATKTRPFTPWPMAKSEALERHMLKLEYATMRGVRSQTLSASAPPIRSFGGLNQFITTITDFSTSGISMNDLEDNLQSLFQYGSKDKAFVCGATAIKILNRVARNNAALNFNLSDRMSMDQTFGLGVSKWATPFGILRIIQHPLLTESSVYTEDGYCLDMKYLQYVKFAGRDTQWFPNAELPDEDAKKGYYQTECGLSIALPEVHRRWTGVSSYAADTPPV